MATETQIRIRRNPYHGYEVWIHDGKELTRRSFDNRLDLAFKLVDDCFDNSTIEQAMDMLDAMEWQEPEYPLGVSYRPVAEAVCDYDPNAWAWAGLERSDTSRLWDWLAATIRIGAVAAPWVAIVILVRWAGGW
jgi:hypothetical protein